MSWLLCDYGNVLAHDPSPEDIATIVELAGKPADELLQTHWAFQVPYDASLTLHQYWTSITSDSEAVERLVKQEIVGWSRPNVDVLDAVLRARTRGYRLAVFSNAPEEFVDAFQATAWLHDFEHIFVSCQVGAKPEAEAFSRVCAALDTSPSEVTFIDDRLENVNGAAAVGMRALLFTGPQQIDALADPSNVT